MCMLHYLRWSTEMERACRYMHLQTYAGSQAVFVMNYQWEEEISAGCSVTDGVKDFILHLFIDHWENRFHANTLKDHIDILCHMSAGSCSAHCFPQWTLKWRVWYCLFIDAIKIVGFLGSWERKIFFLTVDLIICCPLFHCLLYSN